MIDPTLEAANSAHTSAELHQYFLYEACTGNLYWRVDKGTRVKAGDAAGTKHNKGYLSVEVDGTAYLVHRVIWCMVHGQWPSTFIDHEDLDRVNNRLHNLRLATRTGNNCNQALRSDSTSGVKGVSWHQRIGKWQARVQVDGVRTSLGYFDDIVEAENAAIASRSKQHKEFANHG